MLTLTLPRAAVAALYDALDTLDDVDALINGGIDVDALDDVRAAVREALTS